MLDNTKTLCLLLTSILGNATIHLAKCTCQSKCNSGGIDNG